MKLPAQFLLLAALWLFSTHGFADALAPDADMAKFKIKVVDPAGKPIVGAVVLLAGEKPKSGGHWAEGMDEPDRYSGTTDSQGVASVPYYARPYPNDAPAGLLWLLTLLPDGSFLCDEVDVGDPQPVLLYYGTEVDFALQSSSSANFASVTVDLTLEAWPGPLRLKSFPGHASVRANLPAGTYRFRMTARDGEGNRFYSDPASVTIAAQASSAGKPAAILESMPVHQNLIPANFLDKQNASPGERYVAGLDCFRESLRCHCH